jgi:hypothetical protein
MDERLDYTPAKWKQFDGDKSDSQGRHGAKRDAGESGKSRNTTGGSICPTEGQVLLRRAVVAPLCRYPVSQCESRLVMA